MNSVGPTSPRVGWFQRSSDLEPAAPVRLQVEDRLEVQPELPGLQCFAQIEFELAAAARRGVERSFEEAEHAAPVALRPVQREVGVLQQLVGIAAVVGADRDADAEPGGDLVAVRLHRLADPVDDRLRQRARPVGIEPARQDDRIFVPAQPRDQAVRGQRGQDVADLAQQRVADRMAQRVVSRP